MPYSVRYSHTYSFGFSCILDEVKKYTDFAYFLAGGLGGGEEATPEYRILGSEENTCARGILCLKIRVVGGCLRG